MASDTDRPEHSALAMVKQMIQTLLTCSSDFDDAQNATIDREVNKIFALFSNELQIEQGSLQKAGVHPSVSSVYLGKSRLSVLTLSALNWLLFVCESPDVYIPEYRRDQTEYVAKMAVDMFLALFEELGLPMPGEVHSSAAKPDRPDDPA